MNPRRVGAACVRLLPVTIIAVCLASAAAAGAEALRWDQLAEGLQVAAWNPRAACGDEVPLSLVVNVDPDRYRFAVHQYVDENLSAPLTMREWQRRTGAAVLFNGGLFREDYSYLGILVTQGRVLEGKRHQQWQGLFAAEPVDAGLPRARVMDLGLERFSAQHPTYREAAQSLMLLDRTGKPRVRRTGKRAHQTAVAELQDGHVMIVKTAEAVPLWELASCLREQFPMIRQAMAMDGGASSDLLISDTLLSQWDTGADPPTRQVLMALIDGNGMRHIPLPTVIGVFPR